MTANELRQALATLGWSQRQLANELQVSPRLVRYWAAADPRHPIPRVVEIALNSMTKAPPVVA